MSELVGEIVSKAVAHGRRVGGDEPRVMRMVLEGEISRDEMSDLGDMLFRLSTDGVVNVVIDLAGVTHFDYRGVKPLIRKADVFRELGGDVRLSGLSPYLYAIFRAAGAHDAFDFFVSVEDAVASFSRSIFLQGG
jgi:anti-sigma B factor antagonist